MAKISQSLTQIIYLKNILFKFLFQFLFKLLLI